MDLYFTEKEEMQLQEIKECTYMWVNVQKPCHFTEAQFGNSQLVKDAGLLFLQWKKLIKYLTVAFSFFFKHLCGKLQTTNLRAV